MKKHLALILGIFLLFLAGCIDPIDQPADFVEYDLFISYNSKLGEKLLDPSTEGAYDTADIRLYYEKDGEMIASERYRIIDGYFQMWTNLSDESGITTSYIQLSEEDMDTIDTDLTVKVGYLSINAIWYNGDSISTWLPGHETEGKAFEVIK